MLRLLLERPGVVDCVLVVLLFSLSFLSCCILFYFFKGFFLVSGMHVPFPMTAYFVVDGLIVLLSL